MRRLLSLVAGLTAALIPITAAVAAERWVRLVSDNNGVIYIDAASIRGRGRYRYYWQQLLLSKPQVSTPGPGVPRVQVYGYMLYSSVDCRTKIARFRRVMAFDRNSRIIMEVNMDNYGPTANLNRDHSVDRFAANYACARRSRR
jgi:hypothetical protein